MWALGVRSRRALYQYHRLWSSVDLASSGRRCAARCLLVAQQRSPCLSRAGRGICREAFCMLKASEACLDLSKNLHSLICFNRIPPHQSAHSADGQYAGVPPGHEPGAREGSLRGLRYAPCPAAACARGWLQCVLWRCLPPSGEVLLPLSAVPYSLSLLRWSLQ